MHIAETNYTITHIMFALYIMTKKQESYRYYTYVIEL